MRGEVRLPSVVSPVSTASKHTTLPDNAGNNRPMDANNSNIIKHQTRLSPNNNYRVCQLNVESISAKKREFLSKLIKQHNIDVLALQETHVTVENSKRLLIPGLELIAYVGYDKYGLTTYVHPRLKPTTKIKEISSDRLSIAITIDHLTVVNVYKPPAIDWDNHVI